MTPEETNEMLVKLSTMIQQQRGGTMPGAPIGMAPAGMAPQQANGFAPAAGPVMSSGPVGLLVPITIPTPNGEVSCYLQLGADALANPQALIAALMQAGWPIRIYQRNNFGGGGGGGFGGARPPFQRWGGGGGGGGWR